MKLVEIEWNQRELARSGHFHEKIVSFGSLKLMTRLSCPVPLDWVHD